MTELFEIRAFYRFVELPDYEEIRERLLEFCKKRTLKGTILLAREGINSTISGTSEHMNELFEFFNQDSRLSNIEYKLHYLEKLPFTRMKVRLKKEIVRMGIEDLDISKKGDYVTPQEWDNLITSDDVVTIDTRNYYEVKLGTFKNAINPDTVDFRSFPEWVKQNLNPDKHKKVAMFCTGGIRCEKSTSLLKNMGFEEVYHLQGGILQYFEDTKNKNKMWEGDCFVFDDRIAVDVDLKPSKKLYCRTCGNHIDNNILENIDTHRGNICPNCSA